MVMKVEKIASPLRHYFRG